MNFTERFRVKPGSKVDLSKCDPAYKGKFRNRGESDKALVEHLVRIEALQYLLYADNKRAVLIALQAMDAGGKDGTIKHVLGAMNPQSCKCTSFKQPSAEELEHDFLWRIHQAVPKHGEIGIFNRSHYEDVLVVRVHKLAPKRVWSKRYAQINDFEKMLGANNIHVLKFFLHISKDEQLKRFKARLDDPTRQWKVSPSDFKERGFWDDYQHAFEDALSKCSTERAPWFVIPSNHKWFRNLAISQIIADTLESFDMKFPKPSFDISKIVVK